MTGNRQKPRAARLFLLAVVLILVACWWQAPREPSATHSIVGAAPEASEAVEDDSRGADHDPVTASNEETRVAMPVDNGTSQEGERVEFDDLIEQLVEMFLTAREAATGGDEERLQALDEEGQPILEKILIQIEQPASRSLHELTGMLSEDTTPRSMARRQVYVAVIRLGLARRFAVFARGGNRRALDHLVKSILAAISQDELVAKDLAPLLTGTAYLGVAHEAAVLDLVATAAEERFLMPIVTGLLETLWKNLRAAGARTAEELAHLALLFRGDANPAKRQVALKHLLVVNDGRFRELVIAELLETRDTKLTAELMMTVSAELPPKLAVRILERMSIVSCEQLTPAFLTLARREPRLLVESYEQKLADDTRPDYRAELVTGAGFSGDTGSLRIARLAFENDPDPEVRSRAMFVLSAQGDAKAGEAILMAALDDPRFAEDPMRLGQIVLALENLASAGDPNAVARIGRRLAGTGLLLEKDGLRLQQVLERSLPGAPGRRGK